jgi:hypothetical protein
MNSSIKARAKGSWSVLLLVAESVFGFVWWSTFVEFLSTLWFFPLEKMDFSGWEAFLAAYILVVLVGIGALRKLLLAHSSKVRLVALLTALFAFYPWDVKKPPFPISFFPEANAARMAMVATGVTVDLLVSLSLWWSSQPDRRERASWGYFIGLLVLLIVRLDFTTVNPFTLWKGPIVFAAAALAWASYTLNSEVTTITYDLSTFTKWHEDSLREPHATPMSVGVGLGAQLFITHLLFTTHGVAARYLDIEPFPLGIFVVLSFFLGAFFASKPELVSSRRWFLTTAGFGTLLFLVGEYGDGHFLSYLGFFGVLLLGTYLASTWPRVASNFALTSRPGRAAGWFVFVYLVFTFWAVWVVAFKFIPWYLGSGVLKERNRNMVALAVALASLANVNWSNKSKPSDSDSKTRRATKSGATIRKEVTLVLVVVFVFMFVPATIHRFSTAPRNITPADSTPGKPSIINGMIWNIHFGYDNFGRNNFYGVAEAIRQRKINVLGILESDTTRPITANIDVVEFLAHHLNMYSDFGPSTAKNTWGCGLLSSYPIESLERIVLPSPEGELACLIDAVIRVDGEPVSVLVTHFGNTEDVLDRKLQTEGLAEAARKTPHPAIVLSYITDKPHSENYKHILNVGGLKDTTDDLRRYCEYIFYKGLELVNFYRYAGDTLSDTEAQVGSWKLIPKK